MTFALLNGANYCICNTYMECIYIYKMKDVRCNGQTIQRRKKRNLTYSSIDACVRVYEDERVRGIMCGNDLLLIFMCQWRSIESFYTFAFST